VRALSFFILLLLIFTGCSTRKEYFEPSGVKGEIPYVGSLPARIIDTTPEGATLANGQIITKERGLENIVIDSGFVLLNRSGDKYIAANKTGAIKVYNQDNSLLFQKDFGNMVVSAAIDGSTLAVVFADNLLLIYDMANQSIVATHKGDLAQVNSAKIAAPVYLGSFVVFPTLDGRLLIIDRSSGNIIRDIVISSRSIFNNVIFLDIINNNLIAATAYRALSITPNSVSDLDADIKDILFMGDRVFVFTRDGKILLTNDTLQVAKQERFPYAMFVGAIKGDSVYAVEKNGHLIAVDQTLSSHSIYALSDKVNDYIFMTNDLLFYGDRYLKLAK
jgi:WD40 repeat protein